jgi:hypothetical protein
MAAPAITPGEAPSALVLAHLQADHRLAAGDTSDLLPGIDPAKAVATARRILASDYHQGCPWCATEAGE